MSKKIIISVCLITLKLMSYGQNSDIEVGIKRIYSENAIQKLTLIVDSLNTEFNKVEQQTYYSKPQGKGHSFYLEYENIELVYQDILKNISFEEFVNKYPSAKIQKNLHFVEFKGKNRHLKEQEIKLYNLNTKVITKRIRNHMTIKNLKLIGNL